MWLFDYVFSWRDSKWSYREMMIWCPFKGATRACIPAHFVSFRITRQKSDRENITETEQQPQSIIFRIYLLIIIASKSVEHYHLYLFSYHIFIWNRIVTEAWILKPYLHLITTSKITCQSSQMAWYQLQTLLSSHL
jgi:hypothetical protein